ncbi:MAG: shikimate dehydrogenase [Bacillota bacterium]
MEKLIFLLGHPVGHSLSPTIHNAALQHLALDGCYRLLDCTQEHLPAVMGVLRAENVLGCNITIPHKEAACRCVDRLTPVARAMGAINTVYKRDGELIGTNTDAPGFVRALQEDLHFDPHGKSVVLLGAGGAARACGWALLNAGVKSLVILNRSPSRAEQLASQLIQQFPGAGCRAAELTRHHLEQCSEMADLLVNASSVGMGEERSPWRDELEMPKSLTVFDLVYHPVETLLVRQAKANGLTAASGLSMLLYQGAEAFRLWTGAEAPVSVMRAALQERLRSS